MFTCQPAVQRNLHDDNQALDDDDLQSLEWLPNFDISRITTFLDSESETTSETEKTNSAPSSISVAQKRKPLQCTFSCMIFRAIEESPHRALPLQAIYRWIEDRYPYFAASASQWKNSVRHSLSLNQCFIRLRLGAEDANNRSSASPASSSWWTVHPDFRSAYGPSILAEGSAHACLPRGVCGSGLKKNSVTHLSTSEHELAVLANDIKAAATILALKEPLAANNRNRLSEGKKRKKPPKDSQCRKRKVDHEYVVSHDVAEDHRYISSENNSKRTFTISSLIGSPATSAPSTSGQPQATREKQTADASVQVCVSDFDAAKDRERYVVSVRNKSQTARKRRARK